MPALNSCILFYSFSRSDSGDSVIQEIERFGIGLGRRGAIELLLASFRPLRTDPLDRWAEIRAGSPAGAGAIPGHGHLVAGNEPAPTGIRQ